MDVMGWEALRGHSQQPSELKWVTVEMSSAGLEPGSFSWRILYCFQAYA